MFTFNISAFILIMNTKIRIKVNALNVVFINLYILTRRKKY